MKTRIVAVSCLVLGSACALGHHLAREAHLPGTEGWDYLAIDSAGQRLFVSHGTHVEVLDANTLKPVGTIADTPGVHGIALAEDVGHGFVSAGGADEVVVFDLKTLARVAGIRTTGANPDAILYEPKSRRVLTFNGRGRNVTAIDARSNAIVGTLALDAKPEFAVHDTAGHVFVNLEDRNAVAQIDPVSMTLLATWNLTGCDEPSGLAIDRAHALLFSVCSNKIMAVTDARTGKQLAQLPIGAGVDGAGFDEARQEAYASGGDGTLTVVKEVTPQKFSVIGTTMTRPGARTMVVDARHHRLFLSAGERRAPAPTADQPRPRPTVVPDSFEVLMVEP